MFHFFLDLFFNWIDGRSSLPADSSEVESFFMKLVIFLRNRSDKTVIMSCFIFSFFGTIERKWIMDIESVFLKNIQKNGLLGIFKHKFRLFRTVSLSNGYQNSSLKNIFKKILKNLLTLSFWKSRIVFALQEKHIRLLFENWTGWPVHTYKENVNILEIFRCWTVNTGLRSDPIPGA